MSTAKRKLAAIVFADIAGFTDKASQDEGAALTARERVERLIKASTIGHNGRIVKTMGDGAMMEFASAVEAVSCALDIQDQMEHLNEELGLGEPIAVRVGVHVGDVVEEDNDLYGNAVNIASRVHAMAKPGGICITREVYVQIRPILKLQCLPVPGAASDRMPEKVEVFAVVGGELDPSVATPRKTSKLLLAAGAVAVLLAVGFAANAYFDARRDAPPDYFGTGNVERILLPDWVTPGEWFVLNSGVRGSDLSVYFGNRKASARFEDGKLLVQTPADLPTEQTTIAIFEGNESQPLMRQQTQVIRYGALAMNTTRTPSGSLGTSGPEVDVDSQPTEASLPPTSPSMKPATSGAKPSSESGVAGAKPGSKPMGSSVPPSTPTLPPGAPKVVHVSPLGGSHDYDTLVSSIGNDAPLPMRFEFKSLEKLPEELGKAMQAIQLAQSGDKEEALEEIRTIRMSLKGTDPGIAVETESILKTAEAILEEGKSGRSKPGTHPKFAEAFAFSVNRGARSLPGLVFVERQIAEKRYEEARRALELLRKRPDLSESEKRAITRLEGRIKRVDGPKPPNPPSTEGSSSSKG